MLLSTGSFRPGWLGGRKWAGGVKPLAARQGAGGHLAWVHGSQMFGFRAAGSLFNLCTQKRDALVGTSTIKAEFGHLPLQGLSQRWQSLI